MIICHAYYFVLFKSSDMKQWGKPWREWVRWWKQIEKNPSMGASNMEPYFQSTQKKTWPQEFTLHRAVEKLRVFYQVMLLGPEAYGIESRFVGGDSEVHGTPLLGCFGSLRPSENVKIIHLFVMFKEDIVSQNPNLKKTTKTSLLILVVFFLWYFFF